MTSNKINIVRGHLNVKPWVLSKNTTGIVDSYVEKIYKQAPNDLTKGLKDRLTVSKQRNENKAPIKSLKNEDRANSTRKSKTALPQKQTKFLKNLMSGNTTTLLNSKLSKQTNLKKNLVTATNIKRLQRTPSYKIYGSHRYGSSATSFRSSHIKRAEGTNRIAPTERLPQLMTKCTLDQVHNLISKYVPIRNQQAVPELLTLEANTELTNNLKEDLMTLNQKLKDSIAMVSKIKNSDTEKPPVPKTTNLLIKKQKPISWNHPPNINLKRDDELFKNVNYKQKSNSNERYQYTGFNWNNKIQLEEINKSMLNVENKKSDKNNISQNKPQLAGKSMLTKPSPSSSSNLPLPTLKLKSSHKPKSKLYLSNDTKLNENMVTPVTVKDKDQHKYMSGKIWEKSSKRADSNIPTLIPAKNPLNLDKNLSIEKHRRNRMKKLGLIKSPTPSTVSVPPSTVDTNVNEEPKFDYAADTTINKFGDDKSTHITNNIDADDKIEWQSSIREMESNHIKEKKLEDNSDKRAELFKKMVLYQSDDTNYSPISSSSTKDPGLASLVTTTTTTATTTEAKPTPTPVVTKAVGASTTSNLAPTSKVMATPIAPQSTLASRILQDPGFFNMNDSHLLNPNNFDLREHPFKYLQKSAEPGAIAHTKHNENAIPKETYDMIMPKKEQNDNKGAIAQLASNLKSVDKVVNPYGFYRYNRYNYLSKTE